MNEIVRRRNDLPKGRGGLDIYPRNWMQAPSYMPDGNSIDSKLMRNSTLPHGVPSGNVLSGAWGLRGLSDAQTDPVDESGMNSFASYWQACKGILNDFDTVVGYKINLKIQQLGQIRQTLSQQSGMDSLMNALDGDIATVNLDLQNYWQCKGLIDEFKSVWQSAASAAGLGVIPLVAIVTGEVLAAIAIVGSVGIVMYQKYKAQTYVLDQLSSPNLSPEARASLDAIAQTTDNGGILDSIGSTVTQAVQYLMIGALAFFAWKAYQNA